MSHSRWATALVCVLAVVAGSVVAAMTVGPALFADGDMVERLIVLGVSVAIFGVLGVAAGALVPWTWRAAAVALFAPVVVVALYFGLLGPEMLVLALAFIVGDGAAAMAGAWAGAGLRRATHA